MKRRRMEPPPSMPPMTSMPPTAAESREAAYPIRMALAFSDADPVAHCQVRDCRWHGHGDSMNDAVTAWAAHVARDHRADWGDE